MRCKLCNSNEADQTGSHVTSAFLLTSQIGKRGEERGFLITTDPNQDYSQNREADDLKEDYIFCRDCEKRLSFIENYYSTEITHKIEDERFSQNFEAVRTKHGIYLECRRIEPIAFHLLIYSNIWRASISNQPIYNHFNLPAIVETELQFILDLFLPNTVNHKIQVDIAKWNKIVRDCKEYFKVFPYMILKAEKLDNKEETYEFFDNLTHNPNHIIMNEYVILPFFEDVEWLDDFFKLGNEIEIQDLLNDNSEHCKIGILSNERYLQIIELIRNLTIEQRLKKIEKNCILELAIHGIPINQETISNLMQTKVAKIKMTDKF